jgi:hypothetical protein
MEKFELSFRIRDWTPALPEETLKTFVDVEVALYHFSTSPSPTGSQLQEEFHESMGAPTYCYAGNQKDYHRTGVTSIVRAGGRWDHGALSIEGAGGYGFDTAALDRSFLDATCEISLHTIETDLIGQRRPAFAVVAGTRSSHFFNGQNQVDLYSGCRVNIGGFTGELLLGRRTSVNDDFAKGYDSTDGDTFVDLVLGTAAF